MDPWDPELERCFSAGGKFGATEKEREAAFAWLTSLHTALVTSAKTDADLGSLAMTALRVFQSFAAFRLFMNNQGSSGAEGTGLPSQASRVDQM